jgi:hypothetical protein
MTDLERSKSASAVLKAAAVASAASEVRGRQDPDLDHQESLAKKPRLRPELIRAATSPAAHRRNVMMTRSYKALPASSPPAPPPPPPPPAPPSCLLMSPPPGAPPGTTASNVLGGGHSLQKSQKLLLHRPLGVTVSAELNHRHWPPINMSQQQAEARHSVLNEIKALQLRRHDSFKRMLRLPTWGSGIITDS